MIYFTNRDDNVRNDLQAAVEYFEMVERNNGPDAMVHFGPVARMEMLRQYKLARTALTALRGPDPDTGLVPCGCGGKAMYMVWPDEDFPNGTRRYVVCGQCMTETSGFNETNENAANRWNRAMGWKGGAE